MCLWGAAFRYRSDVIHVLALLEAAVDHSIDRVVEIFAPGNKPSDFVVECRSVVLVFLLIFKP